MELFVDLRRPSGGASALEEAEQLLGCYQAFLGHELPNVLVPLQGFARLLLQAEGLDAESRDLLARMAELTRRADSQVRRVAELGRLRREPAFGPPLAVEEVAREALAEGTFGLGASAAGTPVDGKVQDSLPILPLSRRLLHVTLVQLVRNAAQAGLTGRPLSVEVGGTSRPTAYPDWGSALWVRDNGRGLAAAQLGPQLFEPFAAARTRGAAASDQGAGVGLFLVYHVVARWGGGLHVSSAPGEGTCVTVLLPEGLAAGELPLRP